MLRLIKGDTCSCIFIFRSTDNQEHTVDIKAFTHIQKHTVSPSRNRLCWKVYEVNVVIHIDTATWSHCWPCWLLIPYDQSANPSAKYYILYFYVWRVWFSAKVLYCMYSHPHLLQDWTPVFISLKDWKTDGHIHL